MLRTRIKLAINFGVAGRSFHQDIGAHPKGKRFPRVRTPITSNARKVLTTMLMESDYACDWKVMRSVSTRLCTPVSV